MTTAASTPELGSFEPESRALCSDDLCLGLITAEGRCNVCGKPGVPPSASADASSTHEAEDEPDDEPEDADDADGSGEGADRTSDPSADSDSGFDAEGADRTLCSDDSCIGVLGADGRCKVCGKSAEPTVAI